METESQLATVLHQSGPPGGGGEMDSSPLCLQTSKNKRKNFNPRFAETKDDDQSVAPPNTATATLKLKVETGSESDEKEDEDDLQPPNPAAALASFMAANALEAAARQTEAESKFRDFAFKTMQELLNIYGLSLTFSDVVDAFKQQQQKLRDGK